MPNHRPQRAVRKRYPGGLCTYFNSGVVIARTQETLTKFAADGSLLWIKYINGHLNLKKFDENHFLLLTSSIHDYKKKEPALIESVYSIWTAMKSVVLIYMSTRRNFLPTFVEFYHANSIYTLPQNKISLKIPAFEAGNFLINVNGLQLTFIISKDFKRILWSMPYPEPNGDNLHDFQIDKNGDSPLFYNNFFTKTTSSIEKIDPISKKRTTLFKGNKDFNFFGETQGGLQDVKKVELNSFFKKQK